MADRHQREIYCFITDQGGKFYRAVQSNDGTYVVTKNAQPFPLKHNPANFIGTPVEFGTNKKYMSLTRSISYPLDFIKDGAAILRYGYYSGKGIMENMYLTVIQWNGQRSVYELSYNGKVDFQQKTEDPKEEKFTVSTIDDTAWGVLSQNDDVEYAIDCSPTNPKAIPVLFDGLTLKDNYTYQTVGNTPMPHTTDVVNGYSVPIVLINQDGDSAGIIVKDQIFQDLSVAEMWFFTSAYGAPVSFSGSISFEWNSSGPTPMFSLSFSIRGNVLVFPLYTINNPVKGQIYTFNFDIGLTNISANDKLTLVMEVNAAIDESVAITFISSNMIVSSITRPEPIIAYGLRPLDLLKELVSKATNNRFTINSNFFEDNNKDIALSGDALRGVPNAKIYTSISDFFKTFDAIYFMAFRQINGELWMERADEVYKQDSTIIDLGDAIDIKTSPAVDWFCNEVEVGSPKQDYRHPSGRLEFNSTNTFSLPITVVNKKKSIVTAYRLGCYDITFLILDYQGGSTVDNSGDKSVYLARITDEQAVATDNIETFENINVDDAPLEPIIKTPQNNDVITNNTPVIRGIAPPGSNVNIYVDSVLDGNTTADVNGNWSYVLASALTPYVFGVTTGIHVIDATFTDLSAPVSTITVTIYTDVTTPTLITYPRPNDSLYNNLPLIKGVSQFSDNFDILLDGVVVGNVTADESCKWEYKFTTPIPNGTHTITANGVSVIFTVDNDVAYPLITYIGSELDGFIIVNNLPLIRGVARPGTSVTLWLNYITYTKLNTTPIIADANGDWSYQVVPVNYIDPLSALSVVLAPIRNGLSVLSTSLVNHVVGINITGYKLSRPAYSSITGVIDNTVFNTEYSPKRMLLNHKSFFASILAKLSMEQITFQKPDKNGALVTVLDGVTISESANVPVSSLGSPLALMENADIKTKANKTFADTLYDFNNGGVVKTSFRGADLYFLPIGGMKINNLTSEVQDWTLLMSPLTSYTSLLNLYKDGTLITLNNNSMYHSDYNSLHFVKYNFTQLPKYNNLELYDDWFSKRNAAWILNPYYIQKFQRSETFIDQIITKGIANLSLNVYRCKDAIKIDTIPYVPVSPAPINPPEVVQEAIVDLSLYPEDRYFFIITQLGFASTLITVAASHVLGGGIFTGTLDGTPVAGDIANLVLVDSSGTYQYTTPIASGWGLPDIISALIGLVNEEGVFSASNFGPNTIHVETVTDGTLYTTGPQVEVNTIAISEKIETRDNWPNTILIESSNSKNKVGAFFSTGLKTILRVEGLVKKIQPSLSDFVANAEDGDYIMTYSVNSDKRVVRFGNAYGLPDYIYRKVAFALALDNLFVEGVGYTLDPDEKITPSDDVDGHPLYYYNVLLRFRENTSGKVFQLPDQTLDVVVLNVDGTAFGLRPGTLVNVNLDNE